MGRWMAEATVPMANSLDTTATQLQREAANPTNWARFALMIAVGFGAMALYRRLRGRSIVANVPMWPGIGPVPSLATSIGPVWWAGQPFF
jgi:hypothetical protein